MDDAAKQGDDNKPTVYPQGFFTPPEGASQILLVRHGQSEAYVSGQPFSLVDGHSDPPLSELGHHQAELVGQRLADENIAAIYVSTLTRTHQTAAPLASALSLTPQVEPEVREIFLGQAEGGLLREWFAQEHPAAMTLRQTGEWGSIPGAETNETFSKRTVGAIERIADRHPDELVAVFCHGGVIGAVMAHAAGTPLSSFFGARHTSINHVVLMGTDGAYGNRPDPANEEAERRTWVIRSFNDGAHAGGLTGDHMPGG